MSAVLKSSRSEYVSRSFLLRNVEVVARAIQTIQNAPIDDDNPIQVVIREEVKARKPDQNSLMWAGPLSDIAEQAWVDGKQYSAEVWHEHFKREFLPEEFDPEICRDKYVKWDHLPSGERTLVGTTKMLTVKGFAQYVTKIEAFGSQELGVKFHANPKEGRRMAA